MQVISGNVSQKLSPVYLGRALSELGFKRVKYQGQRGYIVVVYLDGVMSRRLEIPGTE